MTLGNVLVIITIASLGIALLVRLGQWFYRLFEMIGWIMEMYFSYCQLNDHAIPDWLYQRYRTINGNRKITPDIHPKNGNARSVAAGDPNGE